MNLETNPVGGKTDYFFLDSFVLLNFLEYKYINIWIFECVYNIKQLKVFVCVCKKPHVWFEMLSNVVVSFLHTRAPLYVRACYTCMWLLYDLYHILIKYVCARFRIYIKKLMIVSLVDTWSFDFRIGFILDYYLLLKWKI